MNDAVVLVTRRGVSFAHARSHDPHFFLTDALFYFSSFVGAKAWADGGRVVAELPLTAFKKVGGMGHRLAEAVALGLVTHADSIKIKAGPVAARRAAEAARDAAEGAQRAARRVARAARAV